MGVLQCNVTNCENIMCDRYNEKYGYICNTCFNRLVSSGVFTNMDEFMNTTPPEKNYEINSFDYFNHMFRFYD